MTRYFIIGWVVGAGTNVSRGTFNWVDTKYPTKSCIDEEVTKPHRGMPAFHGTTGCAVTMLNELSKEDYMSYTGQEVS